MQDTTIYGCGHQSFFSKAWKSKGTFHFLKTKIGVAQSTNVFYKGAHSGSGYQVIFKSTVNESTNNKT